MLSQNARHALRVSLGAQAGGEMIKAIDGFAETLAALSAKPVSEPSAPVPVATPVAPVNPVAEDESSHLDAPSA